MGGQKKVFITRLTDTSSKDLEGVGTIRWEDNKCYKWVRYQNGAGNVAAAAGRVCYYRGAGGAAAGNVTSDLSDSLQIGAGVLQAAIPDGEYGWIQIKGPATLSIGLTAGANGNALTPIGATDGTLDVSALVTDPICAYVDDAATNKIVCDFPF